MPANDLKGLIAWLKSNPDKATLGHGGTGGGGHIAGFFFQRETGTRFQYSRTLGLDSRTSHKLLSFQCVGAPDFHDGGPGRAATIE
jgi:hypothetical protein